jgi:hypothetical protein
MMVVTSEAMTSAARFMHLNARLIDRYRFAYHFGDPPAGTGAADAPGAAGAKDAALTALRAYANEDGGFGNALEPDLRGSASQPQPVEVALRILDELEAFDHPAGESMVAGACRYLETITAANGGVPFVLPSVRDTQRAPWWQTGDDPPGALNPTAAIAGILHRHGVEHRWLDRADAFCWGALEPGEGTRETHRGIDTYTAFAVLTLLDHVPDRERAERAFGTIGERLAGGAELDPAATGEKHSPLDFAPAPDGLGRRLFTAETIDAHLDALVAAQHDDGGWTPDFPFWNRLNEFEWRGFWTVRVLLTLRAYGRLAV